MGNVRDRFSYGGVAAVAWRSCQGDCPAIVFVATAVCQLAAIFDRPADPHTAFVLLEIGGGQPKDRPSTTLGRGPDVPPVIFFALCLRP